MSPPHAPAAVERTGIGVAAWIEDRALPSSAHRLGRLPQPVVVAEQPAQMAVRPEGRRRAGLLAEYRRVGAGLIGGGPQPL